MREVRFTEGKIGQAVRHLYLARHDGVVHVVSYSKKPSAVLTNDGTPIHGEFHMNTWCGRIAKLYFSGRNKITRAHPTCVRCVVNSQARCEVVIPNE